MKITELERLEKGDILIIEPIAEFSSQNPIAELLTMKVQFLGFKGKYVILSRNNMTKEVPTEKIVVIGRYAPSPWRKNDNR